MQTYRRDGILTAQEQRRWAPRNQFAREMDAFAENIRANTTPLTPGEEGLQDMRLIAAIYTAAANNTVVKLPAAERLDITRGAAPVLAEG